MMRLSTRVRRRCGVLRGKVPARLLVLEGTHPAAASIVIFLFSWVSLGSSPGGARTRRIVEALPC